VVDDLNGSDNLLVTAVKIILHAIVTCYAPPMMAGALTDAFV